MRRCERRRLGGGASYIPFCLHFTTCEMGMADVRGMSDEKPEKVELEGSATAHTPLWPLTSQLKTGCIPTSVKNTRLCRQTVRGHFDGVDLSVKWRLSIPETYLESLRHVRCMACRREAFYGHGAELFLF